MGQDRLRWPEGGDLTSWFVPVPVRPGVWLIAEPGHVNSYLVAGDERAALIDTGTGIAPLAPVVRRLTDRPVTVVLTHDHFDHVGGAHEFDRVAIHPAGVAGLRAGRPAGSLRGYIAEAGRLLERSAAMRALDARGLNLLHPEQLVRPFPPGFDPERYAIVPAEATETLADGQRLDLGGRTLEVLHTPGHSPDGVCLLEPDARLLFTADTVYAGPLYAQTPGADLDDYLASLRRLAALAPDVDLLLPGHNRVPLDPPLIGEMAEGVARLLVGGGDVTIVEGPGGSGRMAREARFDRFSVLLPIGTAG
jgi:glyoxylase-like metal-dependent hydrolase (beta-lactamase superfamily II)